MKPATQRNPTTPAVVVTGPLPYIETRFTHTQRDGKIQGKDLLTTAAAAVGWRRFHVRFSVP